MSKRKPFEPLVGELRARSVKGDSYEDAVSVAEANSAIESDREHYEHVHAKWIERTAELQAEINKLKTKPRAGVLVPSAALKAMQGQLAEAREALEYYAVPDHYEPTERMSGTRPPGVLVEGGKKACDYLEKYK